MSFIRGIYHPLWIQINPSFRCNLQCIHCYNRTGPTQTDMTEPVLLGLIEQIKRAISLNPHIDGLWVSILGGDPTLYSDLACRIVDAISIIDIKKQFWLFTNGLLLTDELLCKFSSRKIFTIMSANDMPLEFIEDRVDRIKRHQPVRRVSVVLTKTNLERLPEMTESSLKNDYLLRLFTERRGFEIPNYNELLIKNVSEAFKILEKFKGPQRRLDLLFDHFMPNWTLPASPYLFGRRLYTADPDGSLWEFGCFRDIGSFGTIETEDVVQVLHQRHYEWKYGHMCADCEVRNICQGGYPVPKLLAYGTLNAKSPFCGAFKILIPKFVDLYNKVPK